LPLTISLQIPTYWTPDQAFAVFELIDDLRDAIWQYYNIQLIDEFRKQLKPGLVSCPGDAKICTHHALTRRRGQRPANCALR
jgi:hypothetical protein